MRRALVLSDAAMAICIILVLFAIVAVCGAIIGVFRTTWAERRTRKPSSDSAPTKAPLRADAGKPDFLTPASSALPTERRFTERAEDDAPSRKDARVILGPASREKTVDKALSAEEAEYRQLLIWHPRSTDSQTCGGCGAESAKTQHLCPACGRKI